MRYKLTIFTLAILTVFIIISGSNRAYCAQGGQAITLTEIAEEAVRAQGQAKVTDDVNRLLSEPHSDSYKDLLNDKANSIYASANNQYTSYAASFMVKDVELTKRDAIIKLTEHGVLTYANPEHDPGVPATEEFENEHEVRLILVKGSWKVIDDKIVNLPRSATPSSSARRTPRPLPTSPLFLRNTTTDIESKSYGFSGTAAANYALQYYQNYNPNYRSFPGDDCTNFVSQAMRAGGWTDVTGQSVATSNWWYNAFTQSATWTAAQNWELFTYNRPRASMASFVSDLRVGDILQADWTSNGTTDHSMVVTSKSGSDIYLTYHSNNVVNRSFSSILADNPNATWYGYLISSSGN